MPIDYDALRRENIEEYGKAIGRIGPMLLADRYDDRSHFIFELLQNAEDALDRRDSVGPTSVRFELSEDKLRFSHYGQLFTEEDVRGICGIGESTKAEDLTAIGKFGIGFKAVYAYTDAPEIHSGDEHFAIDSFVWPRALAPIEGTKQNETVFQFPFRSEDQTAHIEIASALQSLGARTLLFLHSIDEISWTITTGIHGQYIREVTENISVNGRRIVLLGEDSTSLQVTTETWLVFFKEVSAPGGKAAGQIEIAFCLNNEAIVPISNSSLVVFFPTIVQTNLGFLIQGPFRTTPSRDNVPKHDDWNRYLISETSALLVDSLRQLKRLNLLTVEALRTLPLEVEKFTEASMFGPLFSGITDALSSEELLPKFRGGFISGERAKLAYTQDVRQLLTPRQLAGLYESDAELFWLHEDITPDRTPELRQFLITTLQVGEIRPEAIITRLSHDFLKVQTDEWMVSLYEFLQGLPGLLRRLSDVPLIRLTDGSHVVASRDEKLQAFLPTAFDTGFPTVRREVCKTPAAVKFLESLGLTKPDAVDDVIWNVLPRYEHSIKVTSEEYDSDVKRILAAFATDSATQKTRLVETLSTYKFVRAVKPFDGSKWFTTPGNLYLATERLKNLFAGIPEILIVDDSFSSLRGEEARELLEASGAVRYLRPVPSDSLSWDEKYALREKAGHALTSGQKDLITDWSLVGLAQLLEKLPGLSADERRKRATFVWEELINLEDRRGKGVFTGEYTWTHYGSYRTTYDTEFVRRLNSTAWVPDSEGNLEKPEFVVFDSLGWSANPFLQSKIRFKPPIIIALAKEVGIEPGVLDLLKKLGLSSEAELRARLGIAEDEDGLEESGAETEAAQPTLTPAEAIESILGDAPPPTPLPPQEPELTFFSGDSGNGSSASPRFSPSYTGAGGHGQRGTVIQGSNFLEGNRQSGAAKTTTRPFISYVATELNDEEPDPDGLTHVDRLALEEAAIKLVIYREPQLQRTPTNNAGFDLIELAEDDDPIRWIEVKAMKETLLDRPVGLSKFQFEFAQRNAERYWLYIVERADTDDANIVRISDPAGKARTFTFDRGWRAVADDQFTLGVE